MIKTTKFFNLIVSLFILISCNSVQKNLNQDQIIRDYYAGFNNLDFNKISKCVSDSIMTIEMEYILTRNRAELYQQFQWDSVFHPEYKLTDIRKDSNSCIATVSKICKRINFLQDTVITYKIKVDFNADKIITIRLTDYILLDFNKWQQRTDSLISWVDKNNPELSGFNNDLTKKGAQNYLKAVNLYKSKK